MHHTHNNEALAEAMIGLAGAMNSARQDSLLIAESGVTLDRALFPLLMRIGRAGSIGVVELADQVGRDHSTVSRQIAKLESLGLLARQAGAEDKRVKEAALTDAGKATVLAFKAARGRLMDRFLGDWTDADRADLTRLLGKLVTTMRRVHTEA